MPDPKESTLDINLSNYQSQPNNKRGEFYSQSATTEPTVHIPLENYLQYGESQYDTGAGADVVANKEYDELRAQRQGNLDKAGNALGRFAGRAITSGLELGGNIYGLGKLGVELQMDPLNRQLYLNEHGTMEGYKEPTWATVFDNEVTRGLDSVDALIKKHLPQYASKDYQNASWYEKMGYANFYFDGLADAAGFAVGSTLGAAGYMKLTGNMFKMAKAGQVAELDAFIAEAKALKEAGKDVSSVAKKIQATSDKIKAVDWTDKAFQMTVSGTAESGQEARSTGDGVRYKLTHDDFGNELSLSDSEKAKVEELVDQSMKSSYMMNLAVTGPASMLVNNAAIKKLSGVKASAMDAGMVKPRLDYSPLETYVAKKAQNKFVSGAKNAGKVLQNNSIEAIQEMYQHGTQSGITDYYQAKFDGKEGFDQILKSLSVGTEAAFSDEGMTAALMGFLTPGVSNTLTTGGGNIKEAFSKLSAQQKSDVAFAALLNKSNSKEAFKAMYEASTRHQEFSNQLDNAVANADDFETKNQMHNIMTNLVLSRIKAGRFDDLQKDLESFKSMPAEQFEEAFGVKLDATKMETAASFIQSKIDAANEIKATNNDIETIFGRTVSPANKERLVHATLAIKDSKKRSSDIVKEIHKTVSDTYKDSNESDFRTHTSVLNQNYNQLDAEGKLAYRNMILASELTPADQKKAMDKINDIDKLSGRTKAYIDLYTELTNPENQQIKDNEDTKAEAKSEADVLNPTTTSEPPETYSEEDQWGNQGDLSDEERMAEANAAREAKENESTEESNTETEQSGVQETELTKDDLEAEKSDDELESDLAARQEQEEQRTTTTEVPEGQEGFTNEEQSAPVVTPKPSGMPKGTGHAKVLLTEGKAITESATRKIINAIKKFIGKNADINNHIILKAVPRGEHVNVQIMLNGKHVGNLNNKEIYKGSDNELNAYIREIVLSNPGKEFTPSDLGIYFGVTDGSLDIVPSGVELTPVTELIKNGADISLTGGQVLIYDFHSRRDGKYNGGSFLGNVDSSLFKPGVNVNPKAIPSTLGRYVMVIPMPNGSIKYVRVRPSSLEAIDDKSVNGIFRALSDKAKEVKASLATTDLTELDKFNDDLNKDFFIAINKRADSKSEGLVFDGVAYDGYNITLEVEPRFGKIRATLTGVLGGEARDLTKVFIAASSNIGSMDALLAAVNKELGNGISISRQDFKASIPEKTSGKAAAKLMVAATTASVVKNQSLVFRRAAKEETNAVSNLVEEAKTEEVISEKKVLPKKKPRAAKKVKPEVIVTKLLDDQIDEVKALLDASKDLKERRELNKQYKALLAQLPKGGDAYRMSNEEGESLTQEEIDDIKSMLPSFISIDDIDNILENLKANGMPMGVFRDGIIYLNNQKATKGTAYHEAFHAVFRTVLKESEINRYLSEAKKEYLSKNNLSKLREDIDKLRSYSDVYAGLSMNELESLVYEEYMADKFMGFKANANEKGFFRRLFILIKNLFKFMNYHSEELEALYSSISNKAFVNSDLKDNRYTKLDGLGTPVFKLIPAGIEFRINEETGKKESYTINHNQRKSEQMVGTLAAKIAKAMDGKYDNIDESIDTEDALFDYFIAERHKQLNDDFDKYYDSIVATNPKLAADILILSERERATYEDTDSLAVLKEMVDKRLSIFSHASLEEDEVSDDLELNDNGETAEVAEKFGSTDSWLTGGHDSLPKLIKQYISFSTYMQYDEVLGYDVEVSVNPVIAYNGLTRIMADTPRSNMLTKLYHNSKYNPNIRAVLDRLMSDTLIVFNADGVASQPLKNHNDLQMFLNTFDNSVTKQLFTLVQKDGTYQVSNANKNDAKKETTNHWANNIQWLLSRGGLSKEQLAEKMSSIKFNIWDKGFNSKMTVKQLDAKVEELYEAFVSTGIKLSKGYIEYSLLADKLAKDVTLSVNQLQLIELNKDVLPLDITIFAGEGTFRGLSAMIADKENLFSKETGKGAYDRLEKIAEANGEFDETIGNASFKNAEGKSVYEIIKASYVLSEAKKLADEGYRKQLKSGVDKNNDLNDRNYKFISNNYLLNKFENIISKLKINIIDGLRKEAEFEESEGAVFGKYDARTYLIQGLAFFATRSKENTTKYIFRQNEASNTAYVAELPVQKLTEGGKPNSVVIDAFYDKFINEFNRISRENATKDSSVKYKDYNNKDDGRAFSFTEFSYIKDFDENLYHQLTRLALDGKLSDIPVDKVKNVIADYLEEGIDLYRDNLESQGIIRVGADNAILNVYIPGVLAYENKESEEKKRYQSFDEAIAEFYLNDYLMSSSLNELMDGDYAISRKDKNDIVKRHKGAMGSGNNYGTGTHKVAYIKDVDKYVEIFPVNGNLVRVSPDSKIEKRFKEDGKLDYLYIIKNGAEVKVAKITTNDAQSYQSMTHKVYSLYALGKLDPKTWDIYKRIIRNERISDKEQAHLEKNKASLNPDKTVTFGMGVYHKTSEHTIVRSMVSYVSGKNQNKFKELNEELINLLEQRDFDAKKINSITKKIAKLYEAKPGMTYLHNLANQMDTHGIDQVITESASKGATLIPVDTMSDEFDLSLSSTDVLNEYKRLQVETPTGKDTITDGSQIIQLIDSEQNDTTEFTFADGTKKSLGAIRSEYRSLMANSRSNSFKAATTYLKATKDGDIDKSKLNAKILRSLEASGSDDVIIELFSKPYNFNMSNMVDKAEQIVLAHFSKGVLSQKVNGTKVSLVSDAGIEVVLDEKGNVIPYHVVSRDPVKYKNNKTRSLGHNLKDDKGNVYSECLLSERVLTKHGLRVGDTIPDELLLSLGYRIPTQDKHSMMAFKIVGLMPNYMEGTGIFPHEIVYLSGADFDIDSEFIQLHDYWIKNPGKDQTYVKYGTETTIEDKWAAFVYYKTKRDKDFMADYKLRLKANGYQDISSEDENSAILKQAIKINTFAEVAKEFNLPSNIKEFSKIKDNELLNNGVINNRILDNRIALLTNSEMLKEIAYTPSSTKGLSDIANEIDALKQSNSKYTVKSENRSTSDLNGKFSSNLKNSAGKEGIGIVANMMQIFNFLAKSNSKLSEKAFKYQIGGLVAKGYSFLGDAGGRISDTMSTILSVMTDNAKDPIAGQLNLSLNLLSGFTELIAQGLPKREAALVINQPIIQLYSQLRAVNSYKIKSRVEEGFTKKKTVAAAIAAFDTGKTSGPEFSEAYNKALELGIEGYKLTITDVSTRMMEDAIAGNISDPVMLREMQINLLIQFTEVEAQSDVLSNISKLLKLNKGLSTSFSDLSVELKKAIEELGLSYYFGLIKEEEIDKPIPVVDIIPAMNADKLTSGNVRKALRVLEIGSKLFISQTDTFKKAFDQTLDILNDSYKKKKKAVKSVSRQLLSYISTRGYINLITKIANDPKSSKRVRDLHTKRLANINGTLIYKDLPGETLASMLIELQNSPNKLISDNALIRYLQTEVSGNLDLVTSKTFAKESPETIAMLLDSYKDLYNMKETNAFAINMFNYLIVKDNLEFKNNTFVKYLAPFMFEKLSNSLDISMAELSKKDGGDVESVLGSDMDDISYNFRKLFASYVGNRYSKLKYKELKGGAGYTISGDEISFNVFQNLDPELMADRALYIKEQIDALKEKNDGVIKKNDKVDISFDKFPELNDGTTANRDAIDKIFDSKMVNGRKYFIFPQFARWNNDTYELVRFDTYKGEQDHPFNESLHLGSSAIYTKVEVIGDKKISQFSNETYEDALQLKKELDAIHESAKEEFEDSRNAIEDETDPDFVPQDEDDSQRMADANLSNGAESLSFDDVLPKNKLPDDEKKTILHRKIAGPVLYKEPEASNVISVAEINRIIPGKFTAKTKMFNDQIVKLKFQLGMLNNINRRTGVDLVYTVQNEKSAGGSLFTYEVHRNVGKLNVEAKIERKTPEGGEASSVVEDLKTLMDNDQPGQLSLFDEDTSIEDAKERKKDCDNE